MANILLIESSRAPVFPGRYKMIKELGHMLVVARHDLEGKPEAESLVDHLIPVYVHNFDNLNNVTQKIISESRRLGIDGILVRYDAAIPAFCYVSNELGFRSLPIEVAKIGRNKFSMREAFKRWDLPSAKHGLAKNIEEAIEQANKVGYPVVLKPSFGYGSWGVVRVDSRENIEVEFKRVQDICVKEFNNDEVVVEEFLDGKEYSIDSIVYEGKVIFENLLEKPLPMNGDNGFAEIDFICPTSFNQNEEDRTKEISRRLIEKLGIMNAVVHIEFRMTTEGPKLLEINPRVPGAMIVNTTKWATNVDLERVCIELALQQKPELNTSLNGYTAHRIITPDTRGVLKSVSGIDRVRSLQGIVEFNFMKSVGERVYQLPYGIQDYMGYVVAQGKTRDEVLNKLEEANQLLSIKIE